MKPRPLWSKALLATVVLLLAACQQSDAPMHRGLVPFRWMESAPRSGEPAFTQIGMHLPGSPDATSMLTQLRGGDVIAFHMSHAQARAYLKAGGIQKLPYEMFRYGHVALVVPHARDFRLLQNSMSEPANIQHGLDYLRDKSWSLFRPEHIHLAKLQAFAQQVTHDKPATYDMTATLGLWNRGLKPESLQHAASRYTCATLVIAALHYSECPLRVSRTAGLFDLITPGQIVKARTRTK
jgi:hypothetical protein